MILGLVSQTHAPDAIRLVIPYLFARDWGWYETPWWLTHHRGVSITRCEQDYRSQSALLCVLPHEPDPDTYILVVDDDHIYHPMLAEAMLNRSARYPGAMIGAKAYTRPGLWCRQHDEHGVCVRPNLAHTTYGILFQRRFFDAGIFNYGAAAHAYNRQRPDRSVDFDFIVTSCMIQDNLWYEAHLARKGIPRIFLADYLGAKQIYQLAYDHSALISSARTSYHHFESDPRTTNDAEVLCTRALASLWGPSLWAARPRRVALVQLTGEAEIATVAETLGRLGWWGHDAAVLFACSGRTLAQWRAQLAAHGGLGDKLVYLHRHLPCPPEGLRAPFASELFDPDAFEPEPLVIANKNCKLDSIICMFETGFFRPSAAVPGRGNAGARPAADVVELCPAEPEPEESAVEPFLEEECPEAYVVRDPCGARYGKEPTLETMPAEGYASVKCCFNTKHDQCTPGWFWRNKTVTETHGRCLPQTAKYSEAVRICTVLQTKLCRPEMLLGCCEAGCNMYGGSVAWVLSPAAQRCLEKRASRPRPRSRWPPGEGEAARRCAGEAPAEARPSKDWLRELQEWFLAWSEEARSTVIEWLDEVPVRSSAAAH